MSSIIRVQPAARLRREFAAWATSQTPKIRTSAPNTFAVPADLFTKAPEEILLGALVDGHRYVSPTENDHQEGLPGARRPPLPPERTAEPGEPLPEIPESAYGPDAMPLPEFAPLEDAPADGDTDPDGGDSDSSDPAPDTADTSYVCEECGRSYATERGLDQHRRAKHDKST